MSVLNMTQAVCSRCYGAFKRFALIDAKSFLLLIQASGIIVETPSSLVGKVWLTSSCRCLLLRTFDVIQIHRIGSTIYYYLHSWAAVSEDYHKISIQWLMHHAVSEMQPTLVDRTRSSLNWLYGVLGLAPPNPARTKGSTTKRYWTK